MKWHTVITGMLLSSLVFLHAACDTGGSIIDPDHEDEGPYVNITETFPGDEGWEAFGLQGIEVYSLILHNQNLLASTQEGLFLYDLSDPGSGWKARGFEADSIHIQQTVVFNENVWLARTEYEGKNVFETNPEEYPNLYRTSDGGATWEPDLNSFLDGTTPALLEIARDGVDPNRAWMHRGEVLTTDDMGETWNIVETQGEDFIMMNRVIFASPDHIGHVWFGGETGFFSPVLLKTTTDGESWKGVVPPQADSGTPGDGAVVAIAISPDNPEKVIVSDALRGIGKSTDAGENWEMKTENRYDGISIVDLQNSAMSNSRVYASGRWYSSKDPSETTGFEFDSEFDRKALFLLVSDDYGGSWTFSFSEDISETTVNSITPYEKEGNEAVFLATSDGVYLWTEN
jgi:photosystem II stability/assembly factor-like uncharacterized protein